MQHSQCKGSMGLTSFIESCFAQAHAAIRENPKFEKKERKNPGEKRTWKARKLSYDERKANLKVYPLRV